MKFRLDNTNTLSIVLLIVVVIGVLSSFIDFGILSVFFSVVIPLLFIINCILALYGIFKKNYIYLVGIILFLISYSFFIQFSNESKIETKNSISLLTYNVRGFKDPNSRNHKKIEFAELIKFIDSVDADIIVLQESSYKEGKKIKEYPYVFLGYRDEINKSLLTIYSKYPIVSKGYIDFKNSMNNAIYADIKINNDTIRIYNTHLQSYVVSPQAISSKFSQYWDSLNNTMSLQVEQANLVKEHATSAYKSSIICGDFNATPYSKTYKTIIKGLNDSYLTKGTGFGTTYSYHNYPLRLDYFLYNDPIKVIKHQNFELKLSDHEPIYVEFMLK